MRARIKRRQRTRRITILATILIIAVSLVVGIYFVYTANQGSKLDAFDGLPVSSADMSSLAKVSAQPYGLAAPTSMQNVLQKYGGTPFVSAGKPTVVYVGGEYCPYCAVERWSLVMALMRFGNFTDLRYSTSSNTEGDYATFTFVGSTYTSQHISFRPYEAYDRSYNALQTVPSNYSSIWTSKGGGIPFLDFGNAYVTSGSIPGDYTILAGKNWTSIISDISTSDAVGVQIRQGANLITAVICKITQGAPANVCSASPINSQISGIAGPVPAGLTETAQVSMAVDQTTIRPSYRRLV